MCCESVEDVQMRGTCFAAELELTSHMVAPCGLGCVGDLARLLPTVSSVNLIWSIPPA